MLTNQKNASQVSFVIAQASTVVVTLHLHPRTRDLLVHLDALHPQRSVDVRSWQGSKNQMTSNGNSRPVGGHLACSIKHSDHSASVLFLSLFPHPRHPGSASLPSRPKCWTAAWFGACALGPLPSREQCRLLPAAEL